MPIWIKAIKIINLKRQIKLKQLFLIQNFNFEKLNYFGLFLNKCIQAYLFTFLILIHNCLQFAPF